MITIIRFDGVGISAWGSMLTGGAAAFPRNAVGFVHAIERNLKKQGLSIGTNRRVAIGVENYRLHKGEKNPVTPKMALWKPWKGRSEIASSVLDYELKCNAKITLLISSDDLLDIEPVAIALRALVPAMRFANGSIFVRDRFLEVISGTDGDTLIQAIKALRASRAQFMISRDDLIVEGREFDSFADALALFDDAAQTGANMDDDANENEPMQEADDGEDTKRARKWHRNQAGWVIPIERGYQAIAAPVAGRPAARDPHIPSIIATPVLGLGEFITAKRFLADFDLNAFWHSASHREAGLYLFNASSFNS
ncbi:MAG: type I-F CRISPR-associated protein Csy2 [Candidatus Accumulibacter sp. UW25]